MNISTNYFGTNFKGLYEYNGSTKKKTGAPHYNKKVYQLYDSTYHPYENESPEDIKKELERTNWGRTFTLYEDLQNEGDYYFMNRIKIGDRIKKSDEEKLKAQGYSESPRGITLDNKEFLDTFNNDQYCTADVIKLSPERIEEISEKIKDYYDAN